MADERLGAVPGTYHMANNPKMFEPQRANNFELQIMDIDDLVSAQATMLDADTERILNGEEIIRLSIDSASVPSYSQNAIVIDYGNNKMKFADKPTFNNLPLQVIDYIGANPKDVLMAWQKLSYDAKTQKIGRASDYKKTAYLVEYTPDYQVVRTWEIRGCWLSSLSYDQFQQTGGKKNISATIEYDYAFISD